MNNSQSEPLTSGYQQRPARRTHCREDFTARRFNQSLAKPTNYSGPFQTFKSLKFLTPLCNTIPAPIVTVMARITVEDCLGNVSSRFELVMLASVRAKQLLKGAKPLIQSDNREIVTALREIAAGKVRRVIPQT